MSANYLLQHPDGKSPLDVTVGAQVLHCKPEPMVLMPIPDELHGSGNKVELFVTSIAGPDRGNRMVVRGEDAAGKGWVVDIDNEHQAAMTPPGRSQTAVLLRPERPDF